MFYLIYKISNKVNGKYYIGCHKTNNKDDGYMGSGKILKRAVQKYGIENFTKKILLECNNLEEMFTKEKELVIFSKDSYNLNSGGKGGFDFINRTAINNKPLRGLALKETKCKRFAGKKHTEETKLKISKANKGKANFKGKKHTKETKEKMKKSAIGKHNGTKNGKYGTRWITNGEDSKTIKKGDIIPIGWRLGRTINYVRVV